MPHVGIDRINAIERNCVIGYDWVPAHKSRKRKSPQCSNDVYGQNKRRRSGKNTAESWKPDEDPGDDETKCSFPFDLKNYKDEKIIQYVDTLLYGKHVPGERNKIPLDIMQSKIFRDICDRRKISLQTLFDDITTSLNIELETEERSLSIPKTYELFANEIYHKVIGKGDQCLAEMRKTLDDFGFKRHSNQIYFHEEMLRACLRKIYQHDYEQNIDRVLKENGWPKMVQEVLVITARRIGSSKQKKIYNNNYNYNYNLFFFTKRFF